MKKFLFLMIFALGALCAQAAVVYDFEYLYPDNLPAPVEDPDTFFCKYVNGDFGQIEIVGVHSAYKDSTLTIPDYIELEGGTTLYPIIAIGDSLFTEREFMRPCIKKVILPFGLETLGNLAFDSCFNLETFEIDGSDFFVTHSGVLYDADETVLVRCPQGKQGAFSLPERIDRIEPYAFRRCEKLKAVKWEKSVTYIGSHAFEYCFNLEHVYSGAEVPPTLSDTSVFYGISPKAVLHVPDNSVGDYQANNDYARRFATIRGLTEPAEINGTSVVLKWVADSAVTQYTILVYQEDQLILTYVLDGTGKVLSHSPAPRFITLRMDSAVSTTDYYTLTLNNLQANTEYSYEIIGINDDEETVYQEKGAFRTMGNSEGLLPTEEETRPVARKLMRNGQILILRGQSVYSLQGQKQ